MTPPPDNQVAALREEIRRAGRRSRGLQKLIWVGLGLACAGGAFAAQVTHSREVLSYPSCMHAFDLLLSRVMSVMAPASGFGFGAVVGVMVAMVAGAVYRRHRRNQFRARLAGCPAEQLALILAPLRRDPVADTRRLAEMLLKEAQARHATELTPTAAPTGRGDEASPAG